MIQAIILTLLIGSMSSWAIIIYKGRALWSFDQDVRRIEAFAATADRTDRISSRLLADFLAACDAETEVTGVEGRVARTAAMRQVALEAIRRHERGLSFLATLAATAPFIGLFGTVWGIMQSFAAISEANDTSLAVVAPGVAEALSATAMGLAVAIPAVVAFNLFRATLRAYGLRLNAVAIRLSKHPLAAGHAG